MSNMKTAGALAAVCFLAGAATAAHAESYQQSDTQSSNAYTSDGSAMSLSSTSYTYTPMNRAGFGAPASVVTSKRAANAASTTDQAVPLTDYTPPGHEREY